MKSGPEQLRDWMHRRRFLQSETAEHLGFDRTFVNQLLSGARVPGLGNAITIERLTGISVEAWLPTASDESELPVAAGARKSRSGKA